MKRLPASVVLAAFALLALRGGAQEAVDEDLIWRIRREATARSEVLQTLHHLTDVHGPRLTGSPNLAAAGRWALDRLAAWGLEHPRLEPWEFGHPGWVNERLTVQLVSPVQDQLTAEAVAWTPGTKGPVRGEVFVLPIPENPTHDELRGHLAKFEAAVNGRIVLIGRPRSVTVTFNPPAKRRDERELRAQFDPDGPERPAPGPQEARAGRLTPTQLDGAIDAFLLANGALLRVNDAGREHGQIRVFANRSYDPSKALPSVVLRNEDYGRIARLVDGRRGPVALEVDIVNRIHEEGRTAHNVVAEIPGADRPAEVVMLGAHLDSWHAATGATDNAIGCAVVMEAVRILKAIGVRPRRTIRIALWSGEEQGLLGSRAYVREHFGSFESPKPAYERFAGYVNIDAGTGRVRGMTVFGPPEAAAVLRVALAPFADLGVVGATNTLSRRRGGSDHTSFNEAGLPGIGLTLDPIEYQSHSWHSNLDTYERIVEEDAIASATVIAALVYHLAARDALLPRLTGSRMPPRPGSNGGGAAPSPTSDQRPE